MVEEVDCYIQKGPFFMTKLFCIVFYCIVSVAFAQNSIKSDSLISILKSNEFSKREKAILLETISFYHPNQDSALYFAKESLRLSEELKEPALKAVAYEGIGLIQQRLGNKTQSLEAIFNSLSIYEQLGMKEPQGAVLTQIATHYLDEEEFKLAIDYLEKAYLIYKNSDKRINEALTLINLGESYRLSGNFQKAEEAFIKTLELNKELNNDTVLGYSLGNLGLIYSANQNFNQAKESLNEAINILSELKDDYSVSIYLSELAQIYQKEQHFILAESKFLEAMKLAKNAGLKEQIRDFSALLVNFYEDRQMHKKALNYQKLFQVYQDSLVNKTNIKKIEQLKASYEIDKRESEIGLLNTINTNQKYWVIALAFGISIVLFFVYLLYNGNKKVKEANKVLTEQKDIIGKREEEKALLLRELNHRVKNNLQMISSLLNLQSNELAQDSAKEIITSGKNRVEALSLVHRKLYQDGIETRIVVKEYVEELVLNLIHGYAIDLKPEFKISAISIGIDKAIPLALIINELVTNAIKHAYENTLNPVLIISIKPKQNYLIVEVKDNGKGFSDEEKEKTNSFGLKLISSLVKQLDGTFEQINSQGTHWVFNLKVL